jgi:hypothetical protein
MSEQLVVVTRDELPSEAVVELEEDEDDGEEPGEPNYERCAAMRRENFGY